MLFLNERRMRELIYGGAVLGAGGGGSIEAGLAAGRAALSRGVPRLAQIDELPSNTIIATLSVIGSVSQMSGDPPGPAHALLIRRLVEAPGRAVGAIIPSEVGPQAVTYGWQESALSGIPIADAPANGRAHPLGVMGSLGLHRHPDYVTTTAAIGKNHRGRGQMEFILKTSVQNASRIIRHATAISGMPLVVARNPLPAGYVRKHAALGGLGYAQEVGRIVINERDRGLPSLLDRLSHRMGGRVLCQGRVIAANLTETRGFTVGHIALAEQDGLESRVAVCNEYLAILKNGTVLAAFPDLITIFGLETALPLSSPEVRPDRHVVVFGVPRARLKLGSTMKDSELLRPLERLLKLKLCGRGMTQKQGTIRVSNDMVGGPA